MIKQIKITEFITLKELADIMKVKVTEVISYCINIGVRVKNNQRLDAELLTLVANKFGYDIEFVNTDLLSEKSESNLRIRAPIVTLMGHVDHGKTSLLDYIRKINVIYKESGGITQNIAAYNLKYKDGSITLIDTPGHESFTYMRSLVTKLTDIVIIVIAADEQLMPQTREAIHYAKFSGVPIIFALNKIDKYTANPEKIREQLANRNFLVEDWGGQYPSQEISSKSGFGITNLLAKILLEAEMLNLKVNYRNPASGTLISAYYDNIRGSVNTLLVQSGTLKKGDYIIVGEHTGKIQAMFDEFGKSLKVALPSEPVIILGLSGVPIAGDTFKVVNNQKMIPTIYFTREPILIKKTENLDNIKKNMILGDFKELKLILKGDVNSTLAALIKSIKKLYNENVYINLISKEVGQITESDIILASTYNCTIIGFNLSTNIQNMDEKENIGIRTYSVIYDVIKYIKKSIEEMSSNEEYYDIIGKAEIREIYNLPKVGNIAGCMVLYGKIISSSYVRLIRNGIIIYEGQLASLKRFKQHVKEVSKGYECGLNLKHYKNLKIGDIIEVYTKKKSRL